MSDLICVGFDEASIRRIQKAVNFLEIDADFVSSTEILYTNDGEYNPKFLILSTRSLSTREDIAGEVQVLRQFFTDAFILVIAPKKMVKEDSKFVKKSGCNYVLLENEFLNTIRLEYILQQVVRAAYLPLKPTDFALNSVVDFPVFSLMHLNQKVLPVIQPGTTLTDVRNSKLQAAGGLYVRSQDMEKAVAYLRRTAGNSAQALRTRCLSQFHTVAHAHSNLVMLLTDQGEDGSYELGRTLLKKVSDLGHDLLGTLTMVDEPWTILDHSPFGGIGGTDRSLMIASMAALTSLVSGVGRPEDVMLAGLFCDLGLLDLSTGALGKIDTAGGRAEFDSEDTNVYERHPILSLNRLMERKIQLPDYTKEIILCSHEQTNKRGFPRRPNSDKIPVESSLILFHEIVDLAFRARTSNESYMDVRNRVWKNEAESTQIFNLAFLEQIKKGLRKAA